MIMEPAALLASAALLAAGTFAFRVAGPALRARIEVGEHVQRVLTASAAVLLAALVATTALVDGDGFTGIACPAGVAVGGVLAWRRAPFAVVVLAAAVTTAALRLLGVP